HRADARLHHPEVVQHAHQRGEEDDRGQDLEGEDEAVGLHVHQAPEAELRADVDEAQQAYEAVAEGVEYVTPARHQQHQGGETDLQRDAGRHQAPVDLPLVAGKQPGDADQHREPEQAEADARQNVHPHSPGADHAPPNPADYGRRALHGNLRRLNQESRAITRLPPSSLAWRRRRWARRSKPANARPSPGLAAIPALKLTYIRASPRPATNGRIASSRRIASTRSQAVPLGCGRTSNSSSPPSRTSHSPRADSPRTTSTTWHTARSPACSPSCSLIRPRPSRFNSARLRLLSCARASASRAGARCTSQVRLGRPVRPSWPELRTSRCIRKASTAVTAVTMASRARRCSWVPPVTMP